MGIIKMKLLIENWRKFLTENEEDENSDEDEYSNEEDESDFQKILNQDLDPTLAVQLGRFHDEDLAKNHGDSQEKPMYVLPILKFRYKLAIHYQTRRIKRLQDELDNYMNRYHGGPAAGQRKWIAERKLDIDTRQRELDAAEWGVEELKDVEIPGDIMGWRRRYTKF